MSEPQNLVPATARGERRLLTVLFCDVVDSSELARRLDPEDLHEVLACYQRRATEIIEAAGGIIARYEGDGILAYFGYPAASEDDAERAVNAALELVRRIKEDGDNPEKLRVRVGMATGVVLIGDLLRSGIGADHPPVVGATPNLAARLQKLAEPDTVIIAASTQRLARGLFEYRRIELSDVRGYPGPMEAFQVLGPSEVASRFAALRSKLPLFGRDEELGRLLALWRKAKAGVGAVAVVRGELGIGKSRLALELLQRVRPEFPIVRTHYASPHHKDSMLYPLLAQVQRTAQIDVADSAAAKIEKLRALLSGAGDAADAVLAVLADLMALPLGTPRVEIDAGRKRELLFRVLVEAFERLAQRRPVILLVEDIHWLDPTSQELLEIIIGRIRALPVLVLLTCRPQTDGSWAAQPHVVIIDLGPIDANAAAHLVQHIANIPDSRNPIVSSIVARADGVPLYVEELAREVVESGKLTRAPEPGATGAGSEEASVPVSLQASLLSRLDRLGPAREVARTAAALGREFAFDHLAFVMADWQQSELRAALEQLVEAELILPIGPPPWTAFSFRHVLIQDAAYSTLLRAERRDLHGRIGSALERQFPEFVAMQPEIAAGHFTKACSFEPAVRYWYEAGNRAADRSAFAEAVRHFSEAVRVLRMAPESEQRARQELDLQMALGPALMATKSYAAAESLEVFQRADQLVAAVGTVSERLDVLLGLFNVHYGRAEIDCALEVAREHFALAEVHGQAWGRAHCLMAQTYSAMGSFPAAKAHFSRGLEIFAREPEIPGSWGVMASQHVVTHALSAGVHFALGEFEAALAATAAALERARQIQHPLSIALATVTQVLTPNPGDLEIASARAQEAVEYCASHGFRNFEAWARFAQGAIATRRGEVQEGIRTMQAAIETTEVLGSRLFRPAQLATLAGAYLRLDDASRALELVSDAIAVAERTGEKQALAGIQRLKGEIFAAMGRRPEAQAMLLSARETAIRQQALAEVRRIDRTIERLQTTATVQGQR